MFTLTDIVEYVTLFKYDSSRFLFANILSININDKVGLATCQINDKTIDLPPFVTIAFAAT